MTNFSKNKIIAGAIAVLLLGTLGFYFAFQAIKTYKTNKTYKADVTNENYVSIEDAPVEERFDNAVRAQRIDGNGWYVKFSSGDEIEIPNSYFRSIYNKDSKTTEADVRSKLKAKFKGGNVNWDKVFFEFDDKGNLTNVTWEN